MRVSSQRAVGLGVLYSPRRVVNWKSVRALFEVWGRRIVWSVLLENVLERGSYPIPKNTEVGKMREEGRIRVVQR